MKKCMRLIAWAVGIVCSLLLIAPSATAWYGECGDVNCSGGSDIDDVVYLINHIFAGGPAPCDPDGNDLYDCGVCPIGTVTDIDGNLYHTVKIGEQWWMLENLRVTHYRNGEPIPHVTNGGEWAGLYTGAYCEYNNNPANVEAHGRLYNWYAVDDGRNIAPDGWHVPTDAEWMELEIHLGMSQVEVDGQQWRGTDEGGKMKEASMTYWDSPNEGATNESGFTSLSGGYRWSTGPFDQMGRNAAFWCNTWYSSGRAWYRKLSFANPQVDRDNSSARHGYSVRCVMD